MNIGGTVNFTNASNNASSYNWTVDGTAFASTQNANYTFIAIGQFEVCLTIGNADPNCSDKACKTINVTCPVSASFTTSNPYPAPGQQVTFANASTSANSYAWSVDGMPAGNTANLTYTFNNPGVSRICLTASNGLCGNEFCQQVFVFQNTGGPGECDTSFLRTYGTPLGDERGQALVEIPAALGGGFLLGGSKLDSAMLTRLDVSGNIVWTRSFDATSQGPMDVPDIIVDLMFDSDNNVVGCGHTYDEPDGNVEGFIFKYNIATNDILWVNELDLFPDPALEFYTSVSEKSPGGNYIVSGTINEAFGTSGNGENGAILEINRNSGTNVWQHTYHLGSSDSFQKTLLHNGAIYTTGRYNFDNGGTARMRPEYDEDEPSQIVQQWSKLYLRAVNSNTNARLYSSDMVVDNGLVVVGQGDNSGTSTSNVTPFLFKTDNDGNLLWAWSYDIPGANTEVSTKVLNLPDGYICMGYYTASSQDVFLFKTDKQGQLQWSKSYGNDDAEDAFDMVYANGQIYFTGKTKAATPGATFDVYFANIGVDGISNALDSCNLFSDLNMTATPYKSLQCPA
ncbi:MAG: hypothetical protein IPN76_19485 [Saprospiraceae bacterium]|nr:hypothetical protein [Saprospiraceae bacterium]